MKVFVIQFPNGEYCEYTKGPFNSYTMNKKTSNPNDARHYSKAGYATASISRNIKWETDAISEFDKRIALGGLTSDPLGYIQSQKTLYASYIATLQSLSVVEVEVETTNLKGVGVKEIKFVENTYGIGFSTKKSMGNCFCRGCGVYFQDIPIIQFGKGHIDRICPLCIQERACDAQRLLDEMPQEQREAYEAERFIHRMK